MRAVRSQVSSARARAMPAIACARAAGSVSARTSASRERGGVVGRDRVAEVVARAQLRERPDGGDDRRHALGEGRGEHAGALDPAVGQGDRARAREDRGRPRTSATKRRSQVIRPATPSASARARSGSIGMRGLPTTSSVTSGTRRATAGSASISRSRPLSGRISPKKRMRDATCSGRASTAVPACSSACGMTAIRSGGTPPTSTSRRSRLAAPCTITRSQLA